jgi:hypothetical protein
MSRRTRPIVAATVFATLVVVCVPAFALNPQLDVAQYAHTSWWLRQGGAQRDRADAGWVYLGRDDRRTAAFRRGQGDLVEPGRAIAPVESDSRLVHGT